MINSANKNIIILKDLNYSYEIGNQKIPVLKNINHSFAKGQWHCIYGASGSGKTTLLNLIGAIECPTSGQVLLDGEEITKFSSGKAARFRASNIGFVFQSYHLLPEFTILENIRFAGLLGGLSHFEAEKRAEELLNRVGLEKRRCHRPMELSGGEQQRAAIARALMNNPALLLADEPTGNLDDATGKDILKLLVDMCKDKSESCDKMSIIMITHNHDIASYSDTVCELHDGNLL